MIGIYSTKKKSFTIILGLLKSTLAFPVELDRSKGLKEKKRTLID